MKKIISPRTIAMFFLLANTMMASAQKKKTGLLKKAHLLHKRIDPLDSLIKVAKGNLMLPFEGCDVSMPYGKCILATNTVLQNPGITFRAATLKKVRSAWDGVVSKVSMVDDMYVVIVKCGALFFAYSNLSKPLVVINQQLSKGQCIGQLARDDNGYYSTDFLLSGKSELNPTNWFDWNTGGKNIGLTAFAK